MIDAQAVQAMLNDGREIAFLDVREEGVFHKAHPLLAVSVPASHLEVRLAPRVPRRGTRVVLMDSGDEGLAEAVARKMAGWGYRDVSVLRDGLRGWRAAGLEVFSGVYVPSKAFGEFVEHRYGTPAIDAAELRRWMDEGRDFILLDSRPYAEFHGFSLPGGIACPGAELVHRVFDLVPDETTTVVVNCAGRTRGIIGAQSLINAGLRNPVVTVTNGTAGWLLNGETMARGSRAVAPPPTLAGLQRAVAASQQVARRFGVRDIDARSLLRMLDEGDTVTTFVFDVRTPEEYDAGHLPFARSAPGGQLIQSTDHYIGTRGARIALCDDNGVRARMTASWLIQMGWPEVYVLAGGLAAPAIALEQGAEPVRPLPADPDVEPSRVSVRELDRLLGRPGTLVLDLATSLQYRDGHIPGAWFAIRSRLADAMARLSAHERLVLTSADGLHALRSAADAAAVSHVEISVLEGGTAAWTRAGFPVETGFTRLAADTDDIRYSSYESDDVAKAMAEYLRWEVGLIDQIGRAGGIAFRYFEPDPVR